MSRYLWKPEATWLLGALLLVLGMVACGDDDRPLPRATLIGGSGGSGECVDSDGDGFGLGCVAGPDCNDSDPDVTACSFCSKPRPGCPCDTPGDRAPCGQVESQVGDQTTCGYGETVCQNGKWSECIINASVALIPGGDPKQKTQALAPPGPCANNPCDPYCQQWPDTPPGTSTADGGTVVTDGGVTLPGSDAASTPTTGCSGGTMGTCAHHLCETGAALSPGCDVPATGYACSAVGTACTGAQPCCHGLSCVAGTCKIAGQAVLWEDDFTSGASKGWSLGTEWQIEQAKTSSGHTTGGPDPAQDFTPGTSDNKVAGVVIGGNATTSVHNYYWLTSPNINTASAPGTLLLTYRRWLNTDAPPWMTSRVEVSTDGGSTWSLVWQNDAALSDSSWQPVEHDISAMKASKMRVRFGVRIGSSGAKKASSWNLDDVQILADATTCQAPGGSCAKGESCCSSPVCDAGKCGSPAPASCVSAVCAAIPGCCKGSWSAACVNAVATHCGGASCANAANNSCVFCFADGMDHDGDGYSYLGGDCKDCDPTVNPGAYDFPSNGVDEDCSGAADDEQLSCDTGLPFASDDPAAYAKAMELCRTSTAGATGKSKTWGVISASLVRADGSACDDTLQRAITPQFGSNNFPKAGASMAVFSSGTARDTNDPGYVNPNGQTSSYDAKTFSNPPSGFPKNAVGCPNGTAAYDSCGLKLMVRAPTNAKSFSFDFDFFSSEYSEWVCTPYNDSFIALYTGALNPYADKNISFDSKLNPVSVNVGFFSIPGNPATTSHPHLDGTGFGGLCSNTQYGKPNGVCGGATGWLTTSAPVNPGEVITLHYSIWDTGDHVWDSTVLMDHFQWSPQTSSISTQPALPPPPPATFSEGSFTRTYDANEACPSGTTPVWGHWSWTATTPNDSRIEYYVKTSSTQAGLASAKEYPLEFSNPPGPAALVGKPAAAKTTPWDTQNGSAVVTTTLAKNGEFASRRFVQLRSRLLPASDKLTAPTLHAWNLEVSCTPGE